MWKLEGYKKFDSNTGVLMPIYVSGGFGCSEHGTGHGRVIGRVSLCQYYTLEDTGWDPAVLMDGWRTYAKYGRVDKKHGRVDGEDKIKSTSCNPNQSGIKGGL